MPGFTVSQTVAAPPAETFAVFSDLDHAAGRIAEIVRIEKLTPGPVGVGTRFKETRVMFGREATETFEFTEYTPGVAYAFVGVNCGVEYRCRFAFAPEGAGTRVDVTFRTRALNLWAKLFTPLAYLMRGMMRRCMARDLDQLRAAAEARRQAA
ncbi:MAG: SRPBCC family protein [Gemmataceae bacterium]|nr:SRPBCC family protein [Gemmataceae bacterium]